MTTSWLQEKKSFEMMRCKKFTMSASANQTGAGYTASFCISSPRVLPCSRCLERGKAAFFWGTHCQSPGQSWSVWADSWDSSARWATLRTCGRSGTIESGNALLPGREKEETHWLWDVAHLLLPQCTFVCFQIHTSSVITLNISYLL